MLLHITNDDQLINEKIKLISMWKLSFILNENIEWHCMQIELNLDWNEILKLNSNTLSWIDFQLNWKEMGCKLVEKVLKICKHEYDVEKNNIRQYRSRKTSFHASLLGNGLNILQFGIVQVTMSYKLWNLKLSYLN